MGWSEYFTDVLGIKHLYGDAIPVAVQAAQAGVQVWNEQGYVDLSQINSKTDVLFIHKVHEQSIFSPVPLQMFIKMTQAMKLEEDAFQIFETSSSLHEVIKHLDKNDFEKKLVWFEGTENKKSENTKFPSFVVPSPVVMSVQPALKKTAWDILKTVNTDKKEL